jgi:Recombinase/Recombinase zinc beta ribbon domain
VNGLPTPRSTQTPAPHIHPHRDWLRMRVEMGLWPAVAPTGYINEKQIDRPGYVMIDPQRAPVIKQMFEKVAHEKWGCRQIYNWLKFDLNFRGAASNEYLTLSNVHKILHRPFYYGSFEYPVKSGRWYVGKHKPIITKQLYDAVQEQIRGVVTRSGPNEFVFTKLMKCGLCGSGYTAEEKYKTLKKTRNIKRYVYYSCSQSRQFDCKSGYIEESKLIEQFINLVDRIDLNEIGIRDKAKAEIERFKNFQKSLLGLKTKIEVSDIDVRDYAKYVLREGSDAEKRELMERFKSRLLITTGVVEIDNPQRETDKKL